MADTLIAGNTLVETRNKFDIRATDGSDFEFSVGDITADGAFHTLDLTNIIPPGTEWVIVKMALKNNTVGEWVLLASTNLGTNNNLRQHTQVANEDIETNGLVKIESNRQLHYVATDGGTWTTINLKIIGYI